MTVEELLVGLNEKGIYLAAGSDTLHLSAPIGLLTSGVKADLKLAKPLLIPLLKPPTDLETMIAMATWWGAELLVDDARFVMERWPDQESERALTLQRYLTVWRTATEKQPDTHSRQNIGRWAANSWLRTTNITDQ